MTLSIRIGITIIVIMLALTLPGASVTLTLNNGVSASISGPDSVEGSSTAAGQQIYATGSIQAAVNAADPGTDIFLKPKVYFENVLVDKSVNIIGKGPTQTIVDGGHKDSVFTFGTIDPTADVTLASMGIRNGYQIAGAGVYNVAGYGGTGSLTMKNCDVYRNDAEIYGGGGITNVGTMTIESCNIYRNTASTAGGDNWGGGIENGGILDIKNSNIYRNTAYYGGGISNIYGVMTITNSKIFGNTAIADAFGSGGYGGGIANYLGDDATSVQTNLVNTAIYDNTAVNGGGGIFNWGGTINMHSGSITNNIAGNGGAIYNGDLFGMAGYSPVVNMYEGTISSNTARADDSGFTGYGGGIYNGFDFDGYGSGAILNLNGGIITKNKATAQVLAPGGGVYNNQGTITSPILTTITGNIPDNSVSI
jgi:hypothetical protein